MSDDMRVLVTKIRTLSPQLNEIADRANAAFKAVESLLHESAPGITASAFLGEASDERDGTRTICLLYGRDPASGTFRLGIEEGRDEDEIWKQLSFRPWDQCSRDQRVSAYTVLPALLEDIVDEAERTIKKVDEAESTLSEIMEALTSQADDAPPMVVPID